MWHLYVWLRIRGKFYVLREYRNQFGIYQLSCVSLLEPQQNNLSNLEAYSEHCQTSKIEHFAKVVNTVTFFVKSTILDVWQGSEYASVIC